MDSLTSPTCSLSYLSNAFFKTSKEGKISIDENGVTTFDENVKNNQFYIKLNNKNSYIEEKIDNTLLNRGDINEK